VDGLLIDSSAPGAENDLREFVNSLNHDNMIDKCFITHSHEDHAGNAHLLSTEFLIPIYTSKKAANLLKEGNTYPEYRQMAWGPMLLPVNAKIIDGPIITRSKKYNFEQFPMNGHTPDLVALIEKREQWAFVADAVQPKYKMIFGGNSDIQEDISLIYQSLSDLYEFTENMEKLLIFSAGNGVLHGREIIKEKIDEIENLYNRIHQEHTKLQREGFKEDKLIKKIVKNIFKRESIIGKLTQGDLSKENLILSFLKWEKKGF
jgi:glyoxylase-like metal-dependent hydrolase (beta-lactamase superfamily II)